MTAAAQVTIGLTPLVESSTLIFAPQIKRGGLPWDLRGGTVDLLLADPGGALTTISATLVGNQVRASWTVVGPVGTWTRAWNCTDAQGVHLRSSPEAFLVGTAPA